MPEYAGIVIGLLAIDIAAWATYRSSRIEVRQTTMRDQLRDLFVRRREISALPPHL